LKDVSAHQLYIAGFHTAIIKVVGS